MARRRRGRWIIRWRFLVPLKAGAGRLLDAAQVIAAFGWWRWYTPAKSQKLDIA